MTYITGTVNGFTVEYIIPYYAKGYEAQQIFFSEYPGAEIVSIIQD